ncbi:MAG TPA: SIMPL domain-containing protein [Sphingomicrobium sp.]|nr:SIMPL domain-containing protein [Sphingomicrobium sp.]
MRYIAAVALPVVLVGCQQAAPDPRGVDRDETLLTVTATGRADNRPDEARLQLGVQSVAPTSDEASRLNREKMQKVAQALTALGVKEEQLQTRNLSLQRIEYGPRRGSFSAENIVEVTIRDVAKVGDAVTAVTRAGANVMSGPDLRVSDREAANRSAYAQAYRAARSRAEAYAEAADLRIDRVLGIYDGGEHGSPTPYPPPPPPVVRTQTEAAGANAAPFSPGISTTEVRVRVDFALERD